ncbi:MAG: class C sortase [Suipraeoptans sp.]
MKKKILSVIFTILFLFFIGVMDYPFIAMLINQIDQTEVARDYESKVNELSDNEKTKHIQRAIEYNEKLVEDSEYVVTGPFGDESDPSEEYLSVLNIADDGVMASIEIPKIDVYLPIYHGTREEVLQKGVGHLEGTSFPVGGTSTHTVLSAHRGLPTKRFFTDLDQIKEDDIFLIKVLNQVVAYKVYDVEIVLPDELDPLQIQEGRDIATLITCTPYGVNTHRIYVHGYRVPYDEAMKSLSEGEYKSFLEKYWWIILTIILILWMILLLYLFNRKEKNNEEEK